MTRARQFFTPLLESDPSGRRWLSRLLRAAPDAERALGPRLVSDPGSISMTLSVRGISGALGAFEYPLAPSRELTAWLVEHPERLTWPQADPETTTQASILRRALVHDEPPGSRRRAQERARELQRSRSVLSQEWWRFEELATFECLLMTDRLVLTVESEHADPLAPASAWYPERPRLVRTMEAARELAGERAWAYLLLSERPIDVAPVLGDAALTGALPHLDPDARRSFAEAYLGNLRWAEAAAALDH